MIVYGSTRLTDTASLTATASHGTISPNILPATHRRGVLPARVSARALGPEPLAQASRRQAGGSDAIDRNDRPARSDALKDVRASHPYHVTIRADICRDPSRNNGRRADEASRPYRRYSAIRRPIPRCLEHHPRTLNAPHR